MIPNSPIRASRIAGDLDALAAITEPGRPWTRRAFTPKFLEGRAWLTETMKGFGAEVGIDPSGNLVATIKGRRPELGTIMVGSHSDTVPDGGRYDGIAGVVAGLEIARALKDNQIELDHTLEVVDFLAEEVSIFGVSCIGSRGMSGTRPAEWLERATPEKTLSEGLVEVGGRPEQDGRRTDIRAFVELHIEQGPILENEGLDVSSVLTISGITRIEIVVEGRADHAGTTPMTMRQDALGAAARVVLAVEAIAGELAAGPAHFAATVGEFDMLPNAANVVPAHVRLLIDARAQEPSHMTRFLAELEQRLALIGEETSAKILAPKVISNNPATPCDPDIVAAFDAAARQLGLSHRHMASGAGHDTAWMTRITKAAMVFVPCRGGRSHSPDESSTPEEIALGTAVLYEAILNLDKSLQEQA